MYSDWASPTSTTSSDISHFLYPIDITSFQMVSIGSCQQSRGLLIPSLSSFDFYRNRFFYLAAALEERQNPFKRAMQESKSPLAHLLRFEHFHHCPCNYEYGWQALSVPRSISPTMWSIRCKMAVRGTYSAISVAMALGLRWAVELLQVTSSHRIVAPWFKYIWSIAGQSESFGAPNFLTL